MEMTEAMRALDEIEAALKDALEATLDDDVTAALGPIEQSLKALPTLLAHVDRLSAELAKERAAVNALPELLAIRNAARTALGYLDDPTGGDEIDQMRNASNVLRAALSQEAGS